MAADDTATVTMTETVSHEITLTHARLAELLDVPIADVPALLADVDHWSATGPVEDNDDLLDEIYCDTDRAGSEDRTWAVRAVNVPGPVPPAPVTTDPAEITAAILAAAADHSERRARALIAVGMDENAAVEQAADEAILFTRRVAQVARQGRMLVELVAAYDGNTYRLLRDLGDHLGASLAYVDRPTVEAHRERTLSTSNGSRPTTSSPRWTSTSTWASTAASAPTGSSQSWTRPACPGYGYTADGEDVDQPSSQSATGGAAA